MQGPDSNWRYDVATVMMACVLMGASVDIDMMLAIAMFTFGIFGAMALLLSLNGEVRKQ